MWVSTAISQESLGSLAEHREEVRAWYSHLFPSGMLCKWHREIVFVFYTLIFFLPLWHCRLLSYVLTPTFPEVCADYDNYTFSNKIGLSRGSAVTSQGAIRGQQDRASRNPRPSASISVQWSCSLSGDPLLFFNVWKDYSCSFRECLLSQTPHISLTF